MPWTAPRLEGSRCGFRKTPGANGIERAGGEFGSDGHSLCAYLVGGVGELGGAFPSGQRFDGAVGKDGQIVSGVVSVVDVWGDKKDRAF